MIKTKNHKKLLFTPLRYPGGKTSLFQFFDEVIKLNGWRSINYIEPYAGGAGAGLSLLLLEKVDAVVINDKDPAIYAFWKTIVNNTDEFLVKIEKTPITVNEWKKQKEIYRNKDANAFDLGFATFFLNRTNHSGVMNAGPIGGMNQNGSYKIDARFNKANLVARIRLIGLYRDRITVTAKDGVSIIRKYASKPNNFFYIDPPYYKQGANLYMNYFKDQNHRKLAETLKQHRNANWILTYDNEPEIHNLYSSFDKLEEFPIKYSVRKHSLASELMIFSDSITLPN
jgi:DNA adenine methylase